MPWINSTNLVPSLTEEEKEQLANHRSIARQEQDGMIVVCPREIYAPYGVVSGVGITYGPNGEDAFFHSGGKLELS